MMGMDAIIDALEEAQSALEAAHNAAYAAHGRTPEARQAAIEAISQIRRDVQLDIDHAARLACAVTDIVAAHRAYRETMETH